ncbi:hypothetical protein EYF80_027036 [Liparis tanakae]|uniref:Uncharacterized protein n=1 Tax=Liparis tanakae TaxID=230148 RepID=A0A4Z2HBB5_9TELE|nr:hypothetical protein EYF80_027036 [Liparis tanakae]
MQRRQTLRPGTSHQEVLNLSRQTLELLLELGLHGCLQLQEHTTGERYLWFLVLDPLEELGVLLHQLVMTLRLGLLELER